MTQEQKDLLERIAEEQSAKGRQYMQLAEEHYPQVPTICFEDEYRCNIYAAAAAHHNAAAVIRAAIIKGEI